MDDLEGLVAQCASRVRVIRTPSHLGSLEKNVSDVLEAIEQAASGGKTYVLLPDFRILPDAIPLLKKHFYVRPIGRHIGASVFSTSNVLEEKYIRIGWGSYDMASMKESVK
jgi:hypothetical protein